MAKRRLSPRQRQVLELGREIQALEALGEHDQADALRAELRGGSGDATGGDRGGSGERGRGDRAGDSPRSDRGGGRRGTRIVRGDYGKGSGGDRGRTAAADEPDEEELEGDDGEEQPGAEKRRWWHRFYG